MQRWQGVAAGQCAGIVPQRLKVLHQGLGFEPRLQVKPFGDKRAVEQRVFQGLIKPEVGAQQARVVRAVERCREKGKRCSSATCRVCVPVRSALRMAGVNGDERSCGMPYNRALCVRIK